MRIYGKLALLVAGVAIGAAATASVIKGSASTSADEFLNIVQHPAMNTDFTKAAESTINGVVSIKSFATPRGYGYNRGGNQDMFNDPFFEFFFGGPRRRPVPQPEPERTKPRQRQIGLGSAAAATSPNASSPVTKRMPSSNSVWVRV